MSRVVFSFDKDSLEQLQKLTDERGLETMGETIRDALKVYRALAELADEGYDQLHAEHSSRFYHREIDISHLVKKPSSTAQRAIDRMDRLLDRVSELFNQIKGTGR